MCPATDCRRLQGRLHRARLSVSVCVGAALAGPGTGAAAQLSTPSTPLPDLCARVLRRKRVGCAGGRSLGEVTALASAAAAAVGTMGCTLSVCTVPGQPPSERLGPDEMEMGLGLHGEPGAFKGPVRPVTQVGLDGG